MIGGFVFAFAVAGVLSIPLVIDTAAEVAAMLRDRARLKRLRGTP